MRTDALEEYQEATAEAERAIQLAVNEYLTGAGWSFSSDNPGGLWMWSGAVRGKAYRCCEADALAVQMSSDAAAYCDEVTQEEAEAGLAKAWSEHRPLEPFCACGRVLSECDGSRKGCGKDAA